MLFSINIISTYISPVAVAGCTCVLVGNTVWCISSSNISYIFIKYNQYSSVFFLLNVQQLIVRQTFPSITSKTWLNPTQKTIQKHRHNVVSIVSILPSFARNQPKVCV
eukprot:1073469_1